MNLVGEITVSPTDRRVVVGDFSMESEQDTIWIRMTSLNAPGPWPWSYGILGWETSEGYELGSTKAYAEEVGETFRLGIGRPPSVRSGRITFEPRSWNLGWIKAGNEPWSLRFEAESGSSGSGSPAFGTRSSLSAFARASGDAISFVFDAASLYATLSLN